MLKATIRKKNGETLIEVDLPQNLYELPLSRFVDFLVECRSLDDGGEARAVEIMTKAVAAFTGVEIEALISAAIESNPGAGIESSISNLFGHALKVIGDFNPTIENATERAFQYKGEEFFMPQILQMALKGEQVLAPLSVIETIEVLEVNRLKEATTKNLGDPDGKIRARLIEIFKKEAEGKKGVGDVEEKKLEKIIANEIEKVGDPDGSFLYSFYLKTLAILTRKKGEVMPFRDSIREQWIQERAGFFQEISAGIALDVDFFLTSILPDSNKRTLAVGFLRDQSFAAVAAMSLRKERPLIGLSRRARRRLKKLGGGK